MTKKVIKKKRKKERKQAFVKESEQEKTKILIVFLVESVFSFFLSYFLVFFFINSYLSVLQLPKNLQLQDLRLTLVSMVRVCNMHTRVYDMNAVSHAERNFGVFETILKSSCNTVLGSHSKQHSIIN